MRNLANSINHGSEGDEVQNRSFELYFKALCQRDVTIEQYAVEDKAHYPDTPTTIRLPRTTTMTSKRMFYRLALAHRALHLRLGTYNFNIEKIRRFGMREVLSQSAEHASDLEVFFATFSDVPLAQLVFELVEDARIDACLPLIYPGLDIPLKLAVASELQLRPDWGQLPPRAAAAEFLLRRSMVPSFNQAPSAIAQVARDICAIMDHIGTGGTTVEDAADATVQLYGIISPLPNLGVVDGSQMQTIVPDSPGTDFNFWPAQWPEGGRVRLEGDDVLHLSLPAIGYRGSLEAFFIKAPPASGPDHQALYRLHNSLGTDDDTATLTTKSTISGPPEPLPHDHHDVSRHLHHHEEGELKHYGSNTFLYPEWDKYLGRYRNNWCRVVQSQPGAGGAVERSSLQIRYSKELRRLRKVMNIPPSQSFALERRTDNGTDIDYDAAVDALIDLRTGSGIHDSVYQDLRRNRRDVAVLLLVDISASTAERVEVAEPIESALPLEISPIAKLRPPRILDIEVISSLLCASALDAVGDAFSVWSFSGTGREHVTLGKIKGFNEPLSGIVVSRAAAMKPVHATRLGAAIRHCGTVLSRLQSETKVLIVLTDGRPFDIDYGTTYGEGESQSYALADSDKALSELIGAGIEPYVLTVDPSGEEYISEFKSVQVELLESVNSLPEKLLRLYKSLIDRNSKPSPPRTSAGATHIRIDQPNTRGNH
ncbi:MAG: hypothetical protein HKL84_04130 [Acidimicrobiaceae bacterium]|nr:hypothetical protein [Acidimicrobiaceae bacterium]